MNRTDSRRRRNGRFTAVAGATVAALALAACSGAASAPEPTDTGSAAEVDPNAVIEAGISYSLGGSFDPAFASGAVTVAANWHLFEGLVDLDPVTREPYAALAADMPTEVDETTFEIDLREGATFHNGDPVTVDDVVYSYERVLDPESASLFTPMVDFIDTVEAVDEDTVRITTDFPFSLVNERLGIVKIVPQSVVEADAEGFGANPIGSGPYSLVSATPDDAVVFERFDAYNGPRPAQAAGMNWNLLSDPAARVTAMQSGTVHAIEDVPYIDVDGLSASADVEAVQSFGLLFMMFNTDAAPFDDPRVRQALFYALDMERIIETGLLGNAEVASSFLPTTHANYEPVETVYSYDPDRARELLAEAGVEGLDITLLMTDTGWVRELAPLIKESFDAVGVTTTLDIGQSPAQYGKVDSGDWQVMVAPGDPSVFGNDPDVLARWWFGDNVWTNERTRWIDSPEWAELDALLTQAVETTGDEQQEAWNQAFELMAQEAVLYPLLHRQLPSAWNSEQLVGFEPVPTTGLSFLDVGVAAQ